MNEQQALSLMVPPSKPRPGIWRQGVLQIFITRACDKACFGCTQGSNLAGKPVMMTPDQFSQALDSLKGYFGVYGMFGGNPAISPYFKEICEILKQKVPFEQRGLWCNNPISEANAKLMRETFNPHVSNLNVHLDKQAYELFYDHWPECRNELKGVDPTWNLPGLRASQIGDSRHDGWWKSMIDLGIPEEERWELISRCDVNQRWSAMIGVFRGELRGWVCEIMGAQSMLNQHKPDYPDTGLKVEADWWKKPMESFKDQVKFHCHNCSMPMRNKGELAIGGQKEVATYYHIDIVKPKQRDRIVEMVSTREELVEAAVPHSTDYVENAK